EQLHLFLKEVIYFVKEDLIDETDKIMIVEDMPDSVKVNYVKAIVQFIFEENEEIDGNSLSEIQTLMAQLAFDVSLRQEVRAYIAKSDDTLEDIIQKMITDIPRGSEGALNISLIKDMIRVYRVKSP